MARRREGAHPEPPRDPPPGVGHVYRRLLVAAVDQPEALVGQQIEQRQDVVSREREDRVDPFLPQSARQKM